MTPARFPHSDTPGSTLGCQLPRAYRRLLRPSSALDAKASTMCPSQLVTHPPNPTHHPQHSPPTPQKRDPTTPPHRDTAKPHQSQQTTTDDESDMAVHTTHYKDARVHYPDLKQQPHTRTHAPPSDETSSSRALQAPKGPGPKPQTLSPHSHPAAAAV